jgi:hypothetical protein
VAIARLAKLQQRSECTSLHVCRVMFELTIPPESQGSPIGGELPKAPGSMSLREAVPERQE